MTYSESPFSQLSDELWHVFGGRRRFPTTREPPWARVKGNVPTFHKIIELAISLAGADLGFLPGEGTRGMMTLYGMGMSNF